jgi:hypothetical protein
MEMVHELSLPLSVFISCAFSDEDEILFQKFVKHLHLLKKRGMIAPWHHRETLAGMNKQQELNQHLESASLFLLLINADFFASDDCEQEMQLALMRREVGGAIVIPILLQPIDLQDTPLDELICLPRNKIPVAQWENKDEAFTTIVAEIRKTIEQHSFLQNKQLSEKERKLQALLADHNGFLKDRLESFVGRQPELAEVRKRINQQLQTGGYVTITGQAGQGKSSIIAKLVEEYGIEDTAFHFIPLNPGPDHQISLLRNLMARLIIKYDLPEFYVSSEHRTILRDYFPKVLKNVVVKGGQEVIFIDGLDQLEEDLSGIRDLSFLPKSLPEGIVLVLGTRPNDTLHSLELLESPDEYKLPNINRYDFDLILQHRGVSIALMLVDRFYDTLQENALYLDLVAKELSEHNILSPDDLIKRLADNPENLFSIATDRIRQRQLILWREAIKPILGVLLVAQESMTRQQLKQVINVEADTLVDGLMRLGGLVIDNGQQRYSLFHLKFAEFLCEDLSRPKEKYIFSQDEVEGWHYHMAKWCEGRDDLSSIWGDEKYDSAEQSRREYARHHYITHLYLARRWQRLFTVLDEGKYGREKLHVNPSLWSYGRDLDMGRQAAAWKGWSRDEAVGFLAKLWCYTLLRCTLTSRADNYPIERLEALVACRREREAIEIAELLIDSHRKISILLRITYLLSLRVGMEQECLRLLIRIQELISDIEDKREKVGFYCEMGYAFTKIGQQARAEVVWIQAEATVFNVEPRNQKIDLLRQLGKALVQAEQWNRAEAVANLIEDSGIKAVALCEFGQALVKSQQWERANTSWAQIVEAALVIKESQMLHELGKILIQSQQWKYVEIVIRNISNNETKIIALQELGQALAQNHRWKQAESIWVETEATIQMISSDETRATALQKLGQALVESQQWERAEVVWMQLETQLQAIKDSEKKVMAFIELIRTLVQLQLWERVTMLVEQVEIIVRSFEESQEKICSLYDLSLILIWAQQWERSEAMWKETIKMTNILREDYRKRLWALVELKQKVDEIEQEQIKIRYVPKLLQKDRQVFLLNEEIVALEIATKELRMKRKIEIYKRYEALMQLQQWKQAEAVILLMEESETKAIALWKLGQVLRRVRQEEYARTIWIQAEIATQTVENNVENSATLHELCQVLIQTQQWKYVEVIAHIIKENKERIAVLEDLGLALVQAQQWKYAEEVWKEVEVAVQAIGESQEKAVVLRQLITSLIRAKQWERAYAIINSIEDLWGSRLKEGLSDFIDIYDEEVELDNFVETNGEDEQNPFNLYEILWQKQQWIYERQITRYEANNYNSPNWGGIRKSHRLMMRHPRHRRDRQYRQEQIAAFAYAFERDDGKLSALSELGSALVQAQQWKLAEMVWAEFEEVMRTGKESWQRAIVLRELSKTLMRLGFSERAKPIWTKAKLITLSINNDWLRTTAIRDLLDLIMREQLWDEAEALVRVLKEREEKSMASLKLGRALVQVQQWKRAESVIQMIEKNKERTLALIELGRALIKDQQNRHAEMIWEKASSALLNIEEDNQRLEVLREFSDALLQAQQWQKAEKLWIEAVEIARTIEKTEGRATVLRGLWRMLAQTDPPERTRKIVYKIEDKWERSMALGELGRAWTLVEEFEQAKVLFAESEAVANALFPREKAEILRELSKILVQAGLWEQSEVLARAIEQSWERDIALRELSMAREQTKSWEEAMKVAQSIVGEREGARTWSNLSLKLAQEKQWMEAEWAARCIEDIDERTDTFRELGKMLVEAQQWERAEFVARAIEMRWERVATLGELGRGLAGIQQWEQAKALWIEAEKMVRTFKNSNERAIALRELGKKLALANQPQWADRLWLEAAMEASCIREDEIRAVILYELAEVLIQAQRWGQAAAIGRTLERKQDRTLVLCQLSEALARKQQWKRAEALARVIRNKEKRAIALLNLGRMLIQSQRWEHAKIVAESIEVEEQQATALYELSQALIEVQQWQLAIEIVLLIKSRKIKMEAIQKLGYQLEAAGAYEPLLCFIQLSWLQVTERVQALTLLPLANGLILLKPELGSSFYEAFEWVDEFLKK